MTLILAFMLIVWLVLTWLVWRGGASLWSVAVAAGLILGLMIIAAWIAWTVAAYVGLSKPATGILWISIFGASCLAHYMRNFDRP